MLTAVQQTLMTLAQMTSANTPPVQAARTRPATGAERRAARRESGTPTGVTKKAPARARVAAAGANGLKWMGPSGPVASDNMRDLTDVRVMGGQPPQPERTSPEAGKPAAALPLLTGLRVLHSGSDGRRREATILKVHTDDVQPYYTIRFAEGGERDTDRQHLLLLPDAGHARDHADADRPDAAGGDDANMPDAAGSAEAPTAAGAPAATGAAATAATATAAPAAGQQPQPASATAQAMLLPNLDEQFVATTGAIGPLRPNHKPGGRALPPAPAHVVMVRALRALPGDDLKTLPGGKACARPNKTLTVFQHNTGMQYSDDNGYSDPVTSTLRPFRAARSPQIDPHARIPNFERNRRATARFGAQRLHAGKGSGQVLGGIRASFGAHAPTPDLAPRRWQVNRT